MSLPAAPLRTDPDLPFASVVVPTFERPRALARALEALRRLDYPPDRYEVIVVDDGGSVPLEGLVPPDWHLLRQSRGGPGAARNLGARHASGTLVAFLDDDCAPRPGWLRRLAACHAAWPGHAVAGRVANALPEDPYAETSQVLIDYLCSYYNRSAQRARFATSNNLSFPLDGFRRLGGFDPDFTGAGAEDRDLCERWTSGGGGLVFADDALVDHFHAMSLRSFVKQHLGYGRGAHRFHRKRTGSALSAVSPEPLRFYVDLLLYPARHGRRSPRFVALMLVSQLANATGFFLAALSPAPRIVTVPAPEGRP